MSEHQIMNRLGLFILGLCLFAYCKGWCEHLVSTEDLKLEDLTWSGYTHPKLGYSLHSLSVFSIEDDDEAGVLFRYKGDLPVLVRFVDQKDGRNRSAWFGRRPVDKVLFGEREGKRYVYNHWDGPLCSRTV